jgi:hypothetical protein
MSIRQLSVSLPNVPGSFLTVSELLGRGGVNIRAISMADTSDITTVRFVVDDHDKAKNVLKGNGYEPIEIDVLAIEIPDHPGSLTAVLKPLKAAGINVHYLYPHLGRIDGNAILILGVDKTDQAQKVLADNWVKTLGREVYNV